MFEPIGRFIAIKKETLQSLYFLFKKWRMSIESLKSLSVLSSPAMAMLLNPPTCFISPPNSESPIIILEVRREERTREKNEKEKNEKMMKKDG